MIRKLYARVELENICMFIVVYFGLYLTGIFISLICSQLVLDE